MVAMEISSSENHQISFQIVQRWISDKVAKLGNGVDLSQNVDETERKSLLTPYSAVLLCRPHSISFTFQNKNGGAR